jgi:hypothetical protein
MALLPLTGAFGPTVAALHRVAEQVVAPARKPHNEIALTQTHGGFGTPAFEFQGRTLQVRVEGAELVVAEDGDERRTDLTTIAAAAEFVGEDLFPDGMPEDRAALEVDPEAATALAEFYAFAVRALEALVASVSPADDASPITLWPEHFDIAIEAGAQALGRRANYGASPGDDQHPAPYVYVGPWEPQTRGGIWNATSFDGAELSYEGLLAADDPVATVVRFFDVRRDALMD